MNNCLFCKIISGEIPSIKIYEDEHWFAFKDIEPCAPVHVLLIPKVHVKNILGMTSEINHDFSDFFFDFLFFFGKCIYSSGALRYFLL